MKTKRVAKSALFTSALALILCVSMLVGTTFAWFTDSVTSKNNIIKSGNLDVELYNSIGIEDARKVDSTTALFDEVELWEPGAVACENLTVANVGTLALKYQLRVNFDNAVAVPGTDKTLVDVLKVAVVEGGITATDRDALIASIPAENWQELKSFQKEGQLTADANNTAPYGVVIYWQPTGNDNDYNMNNANQGTVLTVDLGVHLYATQLVHENDSFGPDYDADAPYGQVSTFEELAAAIAAGESIILKNDITVPADTTLTVAKGTNVTINTNGYTLAATSALTSSNRDLFLVKGTLNVIGGGTITYEHLGADMNWGYMSAVLDITDGGAVYLSDGVSVKNLGGTAMAIGAHLNNWGTASLYMDDASISSPYCAIRLFNSGYDMNNVVAKNSSILSPNRALWVHNYTAADFGASYDQDAVEARLNIDISDSSNVIAGKIVYGFTDSTTTQGNAAAASNNTQLQDAISGDAKTVTLSAGTYTLPTLGGEDGLTLIGEEGTVISSGASGFAGANFGKDTTVENITFSGSDNGVRYSYANGGTITFNDCTFEGDSLYGFHMDESGGAILIFNNCTFVGFNAFASDLDKVEFNNCTFLSNGYYGHTNIWSNGYFNNCTWGDDASVGPAAASAQLYFDGVEESYHHHYVGTADTLFAIADSVNNGGDNWNDQTILLVDDIDLAGRVWTPIGQTGSTTFSGNFDGQGHTISNLTVDSSAQTGAYYSSGLFGWIEIHDVCTVIENLNIDGASITGNHNCGTIAGYATGAVEIRNCSVTNAEIICNVANADANGDKAGVIVGNLTAETNSKIIDCSASDSTVTAGRDAGQLAGAAVVANVTGTATNVTVTANGEGTGANINNALVGRGL